MPPSAWPTDGSAGWSGPLKAYIDSLVAERGGMSGTGAPEGVVTANPGARYVDTAGTNGAWEWVKTAGTGNTGWAISHGDTGRRLVVVDNAQLQGDFVFRRMNNTVEIALANGQIKAVLTSPYNVLTIPAGFRPQTNVYSDWSQSAGFPPAEGRLMTLSSGITFWAGDNVPVGSNLRMRNVVAATSDTWPTSLPGTPV